MTKYEIKSSISNHALIIMAIIMLLIPAAAGLGCNNGANSGNNPVTGGNNGANGVERAFVEGRLIITDAESFTSAGRPVEYTLTTGKTYTLTYRAEKFMRSIDGEMAMNIVLPDIIEYTSGELSWTGNDVSKTIEVKIKAKNNGKSTISAEATNKGNGFKISNDIQVVIN